MLKSVVELIECSLPVPTQTDTSSAQLKVGAWPAELLQVQQRRLLRPSFLRTYALVSLLATVTIGLVLGDRFSTMSRNRARTMTIDQVALGLDLSIAPLLSDAAFVEGPSQRQQLELTKAFSAAGGPSGLKNAGLRNSSNAVIFSTFPLPAAKGDDPLLRRALQGTPTAKWISSKTSIGAGLAGDFIRVVVPVRMGVDDKVIGTLDTYVDSTKANAQLRSDRRTVLLMLLGGLASLWLVLFRLVFGASRMLRIQSSENRHLALHDQLTGLPNRSKFEMIARPAIEKSLLKRKTVGVVIIDLDRFKEVNDTLGHPNGDALLQQVGPRLRTALRKGDVIARMGGDEFIVLLRNLANAEHATAITERMRASLYEPFLVADVPLLVEASFGVAVAPADGRTFSTLLQRADVAMYRAKAVRGGGVQEYDAAFDRRSVDRLALLAELRKAIEADELHLQYQPKVDLVDWRIVGAEALVRWTHPTRGFISPGEFIPIAEASGLMRPLTNLVLRHALKQVREWNDLGLDVKVSVNISAPNLVDTSLVDEVAMQLVTAGVEPSRLVLEITETGVMNDPTRSIATLHRLRELGVGLSVDDFGVGQSSLGYLKQLPVTELKLDRMFVSRILEDPRDAAIVRATVELGYALGLDVVAEGIETQEELDKLRSIGCRGAQGFFLSRPVYGSAFPDVVAKGVPGRVPVTVY